MYSCDVCSKEFKFNSDYERHIKNKKCSQGIKPEDGKRFKCIICNKSFTRKFSLKRHMDSICKKEEGVGANNVNVENINGDNNIVGNNNNINNINVNININNIPNFIRPFGMEDITFLKHTEMLSILLSNDPELVLLSKLTNNKENINFFKFNIKEPYVNYLESVNGIKPIPESIFEQMYYERIHLLLDVIFFVCKKNLPLLKKYEIGCKLYSTSKFVENKNGKIIPEDSIPYIKALLNMITRSKMGKNIKTFIETYNIDEDYQNNVTMKLDETNDLIKAVEKDLNSVYKIGIDKKDFKFMKDLDPKEEKKKEDENNNNELDEILKSHQKNIKDKDYNARVQNELKRLEFLELHDTLKNIKEQVLRVKNQLVSKEIFIDAVKLYIKKIKDKEEEQKKILIKQLIEQGEDIKSRDNDIEQELNFLNPCIN